MKSTKLLAALLSLTVAAGASVPMGSYVPKHSLTASAESEGSTVNTDELVFKVYADHAEVSGVSNNDLVKCTIPSTVNKVPVTAIAENAFYFSEKLSEVTIPASVSAIGDNAFSWCTDLRAIKVDSANKNFTDVDGVLFSKSKDTLIVYPAGKEGKTYEIADSVKKIASFAFYMSRYIESVKVPKSVAYIGQEAFCTCPKLTSVTILDPECKFEYISFICNGKDDKGFSYFNGTLYGYPGSTTEEIAEENNIKFVALDTPAPVTTTTTSTTTTATTTKAAATSTSTTTKAAATSTATTTKAATTSTAKTTKAAVTSTSTTAKATTTSTAKTTKAAVTSTSTTAKATTTSTATTTKAATTSTATTTKATTSTAKTTKAAATSTATTTKAATTSTATTTKAATTSTATTTKATTTSTSTTAKATTTSTTTTTKAAATSTATTTKAAATSTATTTKAATTSTATTTKAATTTTTPAKNDYKLGDVDHDGNVNAADASAVLQHYAATSTGKKGSFTKEQLIIADVNKDGEVNAIDASHILSYYAYRGVTHGDKVMTIEEFIASKS